MWLILPLNEIIPYLKMLIARRRKNNFYFGTYQINISADCIIINKINFSDHHLF